MLAVEVLAYWKDKIIIVVLKTNHILGHIYATILKIQKGTQMFKHYCKILNLLSVSFIT